MPKRLLLEGTDLDELMVRVRAEMGPNARIIQAERVRSGGVGGFFAREHYEVTVEVPDDAADSSRGGRPAFVAARTSAGSGGGAGTARAMSGIEALLAEADAADVTDEAERGWSQAKSAHSPALEPHVSTGGDAFASVLDSVRNLAAGAPVKASARAVPPSVSTPLVTVEPRKTTPVVWPTAEATAPVFARAGSEPAGYPAQPRSAPTDAGSGFTMTRPTVVSPRRGSSARELEFLGVPQKYLRPLTAWAGPDTRYTLSDVLSQVPRAPQVVRRPGSIIVVVGVGATPMRVALRLANQIGLDETQIALAGSFGASSGRGQWVINALAAQRLRTDAVQTGVPLLVSMTVGAGEFWEAETADIIAALGPDQLWAAVEADRDASDTSRWLGAVEAAHPFDALAAEEVGQIRSPARVLEYGIPVGLLDGLYASAPVWAATLSARLDDAAWD